MAGDRFFSIHPRRGTNSILDKKAGAYMHTIASVMDIAGTLTTPKAAAFCIPSTITCWLAPMP